MRLSRKRCGGTALFVKPNFKFAAADMATAHLSEDLSLNFPKSQKGLKY